jgi:hypothetical protein
MVAGLGNWTEINPVGKTILFVISEPPAIPYNYIMNADDLKPAWNKMNKNSFKGKGRRRFK